MSCRTWQQNMSVLRLWILACNNQQQMPQLNHEVDMICKYIYIHHKSMWLSCWEKSLSEKRIGHVGAFIFKHHLELCQRDFSIATLIHTLIHYVNLANGRTNRFGTSANLAELFLFVWCAELSGKRSLFQISNDPKHDFRPSWDHYILDKLVASKLVACKVSIYPAQKWWPNNYLDLLQWVGTWTKTIEVAKKQPNLAAWPTHVYAAKRRRQKKIPCVQPSVERQSPKKLEQLVPV